MPYANPQHKKEWASAHKEEAAASSRRYYEENRTAILESRRLQSTGWTTEMVAASLVEQGNACMICRKVFKVSANRTETPYADHDHDTMEPRSLLCHACNVALGFLNDDPELCIAAAEYLKSWKGAR